MTCSSPRIARLAPAALAALLAACAAALAAPPEPFEADGKWGFREAGSGAVLVEPVFQRAGAFREGLAPVMVSGKWGYVDESGRFAIEPSSPAAQPPRSEAEGLTAFLKGGKWGYLDKSGSAAIANNFHEAGDFSEGLAAVRLNSDWGYIDRKGGFALWPAYYAAGPFSGGLALVELAVPAPAGSLPPVKIERLWIDRSGRQVYVSSGSAGDGMEVIVSTSGRYGYAAGGKPVISAEYDSAAGCADGLCLVQKDGRYMFVDRSGVPALDTGFADAAHLGCGFYRVRQGLKYGLMNSTGSLLAQAVYDSIEGQACEDRITGVFSGIKGRIAAADGEFSVGAAAAASAPVELSGDCERAGKMGEEMPYRELAERCGAEELKAMGLMRPDCVNCRLALAALYASTAAPGGKADHAAAAAAIGEAIRISTGTPALLRWRAGLLMSAGATSAGQAVEDYKQLIALEPDVPAHYRGICGAYALAGPEAGEPELASYFCDKAVMLEPGYALNYLSRGGFRRSLGDKAGAMEDFRAAVKLAPDDARVRLARARLSAELGQDFRTVFDCSWILQRDAGDPEVLEERGLAYIRTGACAKALADLQAAGRLRPGPENLRKFAVYYWNCESDVVKTAWVAEDLIRMGDRCGGACWPPAAYDRYLSGFYATAAYRELLSRYGLGAPADQIQQPEQSDPVADGKI